MKYVNDGILAFFQISVYCANLSFMYDFSFIVEIIIPLSCQRCYNGYHCKTFNITAVHYFLRFSFPEVTLVMACDYEGGLSGSILPVTTTQWLPTCCSMTFVLNRKGRARNRTGTLLDGITKYGPPVFYLETQLRQETRTAHH